MFVVGWRLLASCIMFFFLMIRRPPRSTLDRSSAASDVYKRQLVFRGHRLVAGVLEEQRFFVHLILRELGRKVLQPVSYTHLRAHETVLDLVCRLLLEKKKKYLHNTLFILFG